MLALALALADFSPTSRADEPPARELGAVDDGDESDADAEADEVAALRVAWSIGCAPSRAAEAVADALADAVEDAVTDAFAFDAAGALERLEAFASFHGPDFYGLPRNAGKLTLTSVFEGRTHSERIGLFLAMLELVRQGRVRVRQDELEDPIEVTLSDDLDPNAPRF